MNRTHPAHAAPRRGAALPIVLVFLALLALLTATTFPFVDRSARSIRALNERADARLALQSAEAETLFVFLTAQPGAGGVYLRPQEASSIFGEQTAEGLSEADIWRGDGDWRRSEQNGKTLAVRFLDSAGLISLNGAGPAFYATFLQAIGAPRDAAESFAAKLADFQDEDINRQFRGAERADYRIAQAPPPTNSPLRAPEELESVLGVDQLPPIVRRRLLEYGSFAPALSAPKRAFVPKSLHGMLDALAEIDQTFASSESDTFSGARARFSLVAPVEAGVIVRTIEIERTATAIDVPYRRTFIDDHVAQPADDDQSAFIGVDFAALRLYETGDGGRAQALVNELAAVLEASDSTPLP
jgi:hypothetical protein